MWSAPDRPGVLRPRPPEHRPDCTAADLADSHIQTRFQWGIVYEKIESALISSAKNDVICIRIQIFVQAYFTAHLQLNEVGDGLMDTTLDKFIVLKTL
jgi:hypothetical protein